MFSLLQYGLLSLLIVTTVVFGAPSRLYATFISDDLQDANKVYALMVSIHKGIASLTEIIRTDVQVAALFSFSGVDGKYPLVYDGDAADSSSDSSGDGLGSSASAVGSESSGTESGSSDGANAGEADPGPAADPGPDSAANDAGQSGGQSAVYSVNPPGQVADVNSPNAVAEAEEAAEAMSAAVAAVAEAVAAIADSPDGQSAAASPGVGPGAASPGASPGAPGSATAAEGPGTESASGPGSAASPGSGGGAASPGGTSSAAPGAESSSNSPGTVGNQSSPDAVSSAISDLSGAIESISHVAQTITATSAVERAQWNSSASVVHLVNAVSSISDAVDTIENSHLSETRQAQRFVNALDDAVGHIGDAVDSIGESRRVHTTVKPSVNAPRPTQVTPVTPTQTMSNYPSTGDVTNTAWQSYLPNQLGAYSIFKDGKLFMKMNNVTRDAAFGNCATHRNSSQSNVTCTWNGITVPIKPSKSITPASDTLTATPRSGAAPLTVSFKSTLGTQIEFGDGTVESIVYCQAIGCPQTGFEVTHTYGSAGTYTAKSVRNGQVIGTVTITVSGLKPPCSNDLTLNCLPQMDFDLSDVGSVTVRYVDPNPTMADEEYNVYTITLKSGRVITVQIAVFTTEAYRTGQFRSAGYIGDINALVAMASNVTPTPPTKCPAVYPPTEGCGGVTPPPKTFGDPITLCKLDDGNFTQTECYTIINNAYTRYNDSYGKIFAQTKDPAYGYPAFQVLVLEEIAKMRAGLIKGKNSVGI